MSFYFFHYSNHLLLDIYPLSRAQYKKKSMPRRASYDYLNQIIENAYKTTQYIMKAVGVSPVGSTYYQRFHQAKVLNVFPTDLADALIDFSHVRNKAVHENFKVNETLELYDKLIELITVGFALFELFGAFEYGINNGIPENITYDEIVVDKKYLLMWLEPRRANTQDDETDKEHEARKAMARSKLEAADFVPTYIIDLDLVWKHFA